MTFSFEPRPYQWDGIEFLANHHRAALFDEPGLGKSMQALLSMRDRTPMGQLLVVATGDAWGVWEDEARLWLDEETGMFVGSKPPETELDASVVVTSYARMANVLGARPWAGVIFDEVQALRNRNTATRFKAIRPFFDKSRHGLSKVPLYGLSGTPIVKAAGDIWPMLHLIDKRYWSSYWRFVQQFAITWEDQFGWHVEGVMNAKALREEVRQVALWRLIKDVQPDLPPKIRQRIPLVMTTKQAKAYRELERDLMTEVDLPSRMSRGPYVLAQSSLDKETRLRQLLACPRILGIEDDGAALAMIAEHASETAQPFVIYSPFVEALKFAQAALTKRAGRRPTYLAHGGMGTRFHKTISLFKEAARKGPEPPILLCTTEMGKSWSVSREVHYLYHLGFDWNDVTMHQAESRVQRDGQMQTTWAYYPVHQGTHDEDALALLAEKKRLADVILERKRRLARLF